MSEIEHKQRFGKMFPDSVHLEDQGSSKGKS